MKYLWSKKAFFSFLLFILFTSNSISLTQDCRTFLSEIFRNSKNEYQINRFLDLQSKLTVYRLAWSIRKGEFYQKLISRVRKILKEDQDKDFQLAKSDFENLNLASFSSYTINDFSYLEKILKDQREEFSDDEKPYYIDLNDMKLIFLLAEQEKITRGDGRAWKRLIDRSDVSDESLIAPNDEIMIQGLVDEMNKFLSNLTDPDGNQPCLNDFKPQRCGEKLEVEPFREVLDLVLDSGNISRFYSKNLYNDPVNASEVKFDAAQSGLLENQINLVLKSYHFYFDEDFLRRNPDLTYQLAYAIEHDLRHPETGEEVFYFKESDGNYYYYRRPEIKARDELLKMPKWDLQFGRTELYNLRKELIEKKEKPCGYSQCLHDCKDSSQNIPELTENIDVAGMLHHPFFPYRVNFVKSLKAAQAIRYRKLKDKKGEVPNVIYYNNTFCDTRTGFVIDGGVDDFFRYTDLNSGEKERVAQDLVQNSPTGEQYQCLRRSLITAPENLRNTFESSKDNFFTSFEQGKKDFTYECNGKLYDSSSTEIETSKYGGTKRAQALIEGRPYYERDGKLYSSTDEKEIAFSDIISGLNQKTNSTLKIEEVPEEQKLFLVKRYEALSRNAPFFILDEAVYFSENGKQVSGESILEGGVDSRSLRKAELFLNEPSLGISFSGSGSQRNLKTIQTFHSNFDSLCDTYTVADKENGYISVYSNKSTDPGDYLFRAEAIFGKNEGDKRTKFFSYEPENAGGGNHDTSALTSAGIFLLGEKKDKFNKEMAESSYSGGLLDMMSYNAYGAGEMKSTPIGVHRIPDYLRAGRAWRLRDGDPTNNRVSGGCINVLDDVFDKIKSYIGTNDYCPMYVLPEEENTEFRIENGELTYRPADMSLCMTEFRKSSSNGCSTEYHFTPPKAKRNVYKEIETFTLNQEFLNASELPESTYNIYCGKINPTMKSIENTAMLRRTRIAIRDYFDLDFDVDYTSSEEVTALCREKIRQVRDQRVQAFMDELKNEKTNIIQSLSDHGFHITNDEYNDLARLSVGVLAQETDYCVNFKGAIKDEAPMIVDILKDVMREDEYYKDSPNSKGCTQVKNSERFFKEYLGRDFDESTLDQNNPEDAAVASFLVLYEGLIRTRNMGNQIAKFSDEGTDLTNYSDFLYHYYKGRDEVISGKTLTPFYPDRASVKVRDVFAYTRLVEGDKINVKLPQAPEEELQYAENQFQ